MKTKYKKRRGLALMVAMLVTLTTIVPVMSMADTAEGITGGAIGAPADTSESKLTKTPEAPKDINVLFDILKRDVFSRNVEFGTTLAQLDLPKQLSGKDSDGNSVIVKDIKWEHKPSDTQYNGSVAGNYLFVPKLPDGYTMDTSKVDIAKEDLKVLGYSDKEIKDETYPNTPAIWVTVQPEKDETKAPAIKSTGVQTKSSGISTFAVGDITEKIKITNLEVTVNGNKITPDGSPIALNDKDLFKVRISWEMINPEEHIQDGEFAYITAAAGMPFENKTISGALEGNKGTFIFNPPKEGGNGALDIGVFKLTFNDTLSKQENIKGFAEASTRVEYSQVTDPVETLESYSEKQDYVFTFKPQNVSKGDVAKTVVQQGGSGLTALKNVQWQIEVNKNLTLDKTSTQIKDTITKPNGQYSLHAFDKNPETIVVQELQVNYTSGVATPIRTLGKNEYVVSYEESNTTDGIPDDTMVITIKGDSPFYGKAYRVTYQTIPDSNITPGATSYFNTAYFNAVHSDAYRSYTYTAPTASSVSKSADAPVFNAVTGKGTIKWTAAFTSAGYSFGPNIVINDAFAYGKYDPEISMLLMESTLSVKVGTSRSNSSQHTVLKNVGAATFSNTDYNEYRVTGSTTKGFKIEFNPNLVVPAGQNIYLDYNTEFDLNNQKGTDGQYKSSSYKFENTISLNNLSRRAESTLSLKASGITKSASDPEFNKETGKGTIAWEASLTTGDHSFGPNLVVNDAFSYTGSYTPEISMLLKESTLSVKVGTSKTSASSLKNVGAATFSDTDYNEYRVTGSTTTGFKIEFNPNLVVPAGQNIYFAYTTEFDLNKQKGTDGQYSKTSYVFKNTISTGTLSKSDDSTLTITRSKVTKSGNTPVYDPETQKGTIAWNSTIEAQGYSLGPNLKVQDSFSYGSTTKPFYMELMADTVDIKVGTSKTTSSRYTQLTNIGAATFSDTNFNQYKITGSTTTGFTIEFNPNLVVPAGQNIYIDYTTKFDLSNQLDANKNYTDNTFKFINKIGIGDNTGQGDETLTISSTRITKNSTTPIFNTTDSKGTIAWDSTIEPRQTILGPNLVVNDTFSYVGTYNPAIAMTLKESTLSVKVGTSKASATEYTNLSLNGGDFTDTNLNTYKVVDKGDKGFDIVFNPKLTIAGKNIYLDYTTEFDLTKQLKEDNTYLKSSYIFKNVIGVGTITKDAQSTLTITNLNVTKSEQGSTFNESDNTGTITWRSTIDPKTFTLGPGLVIKDTFMYETPNAPFSMELDTTTLTVKRGTSRTNASQYTLLTNVGENEFTDANLNTYKILNKGAEGFEIIFNPKLTITGESIYLDYNTKFDLSDQMDENGQYKYLFYTFKNRIGVGSSTSDAEKTITVPKTNIDNGSKSGSLKDGVITWTIDANTNKVNLGNADFVMTDVFPEGPGLVQYVPGSLKVEKIGEKNELLVESVNGAQGDYTFNLTPATEGSNLPDTGFVLSIKTPGSSQYRVTYDTHLFGQPIKGKYTNKVTFNNGKTVSGSVDNSIVTLLDKKGAMNSQNNDIIDWTVTVNQAKTEIRDAVITDTLAIGQIFNIRSVVVVRNDPNGRLLVQNTSGQKDGDYDLVIDSTSASDGSTKVQLIFNDDYKFDTSHSITYSSTVDVSTAPIQQGEYKVSNEVVLEGKEIVRSSVIRNVIEYWSSAGGGVGGDGRRLPIRILKVDKDNQEGLPGAWFEITTTEYELEETKRESLDDGYTAPIYLKPGNYTITEITPPEDYELSANPSQEITISEEGYDELEGDTFVFKFENPKVKKYDAALRKWVSKVERSGKVVETFTEPEEVLASPAAVRNGDDVTFTIKLFNQCEETIRIPSVSDYMPNGYTFDPDHPSNENWTAAGGILTYRPSTPIELLEGEDTPITLVLKVNVTEENTDLVNYAEISEMTDDKDAIVPDVDSNPDANPSNDNHKHEDDNKILEDSTAGGDEDDYDEAEVVLEGKKYDAALRKWVSKVFRNGEEIRSYPEPVEELVSPAAVRNGDDVEFTIKLFNQCEETVRIPSVSDYMPNGYTFDPEHSSNENWTAAGGILTYRPSTPIELLEGEDTPITLVLKVNVTEGNTDLVNYAEISEMTDDKDYKVPDVDSNPDDNPSNDNHKHEDDNKILEDSTAGGDEDDYDEAEVVLDERLYDAALRKWVSKIERNDEEVESFDDPGTTPSAIAKVMIEDKVTFSIKVFNQCEEPVKITTISDYVPEGYTFDAKDNEYWTSTSEGLLTYEPENPIELAPEEDYTIELVLTVNENASNNNLKNYAEITEMLNEDNDVVEDVDSTPDADPTNDGKTEKDNVVDEHRQDNPNKTEDDEQDEDDHDFAEVVLIQISVEVDKDTIKRTSAAFEDEDIDGNVISNVGDHHERFRYDIDFRSTSNITADEFIYDDHLEKVEHGLAIIEEIWTPRVYGDIDEKFNLLIKTDARNTNNPTSSNPKVVNSEFDYTGWFLVKEGLSTSTRHHFTADELVAIAGGTKITAIRLDYGAVDVGFTTLHAKKVSNNGEHRDNDGNVLLPEDHDRLNENIPRSPLNSVSTFNLNMLTLGTSIGTFATGIDNSEDGNHTIDWTVDDDAHHYSEGASAAAGDLRPLQYMVSATAPINNEDVNIVSSGSARIALSGMKDEDHDAVLTKEIVPASFTPENPKVDMLEFDGSEFDPPEARGTEVNGPSREPLTSDEMKMAMWIIIMLVVGLSFIVAIRQLYKTKRDASKGGAI